MEFDDMQGSVNNSFLLHEVLNNNLILKDFIKLNNVAVLESEKCYFMIESFLPNFQKFLRNQELLNTKGIPRSVLMDCFANTEVFWLQVLQVFTYEYYGSLKTVCDLQGCKDEIKDFYTLTDVEFTNTLLKDKDKKIVDIIKYFDKSLISFIKQSLKPEQKKKIKGNLEEFIVITEKRFDNLENILTILNSTLQDLSKSLTKESKKRKKQ